MNARRARCRTGRGGALCFRVSFFSVRSSSLLDLQQRAAESHTTVTAGQKRKSVVILWVKKISAKKAGQLFARPIRTGGPTPL